MDRTVYDLEARFFLHTVAPLVACELSRKSATVYKLMRYTQKKQVDTLRVAEKAHHLGVASRDFGHASLKWSKRAGSAPRKSAWL